MFRFLLEWEVWYTSFGRGCLAEIVREPIELRFHFLRYSLLRLKLSIVPVAEDISAVLEVLRPILRSVIYIVQSWLFASQHRQPWKDAYKYYFETAVINLFDIWKQIYNIPEYSPVLNEFNMRLLCENVVNVALELEKNGGQSALSICGLGVMILQRDWNYTWESLQNDESRG